MYKKIEFIKKDKIQWVLIFLIITLAAFLIRFYLFENRNSWHDEWHSIYVADPNISNEITLKRFWGEKGEETLTEYYPPLYLFLLKYFFKLFGYLDDNGRLFSLIFGTLSVSLSMYLTTYFDSSKKNVIIVGLLTAVNLFLIWQSLEIRAHSIVVFSVLLNLCFFFEILRSESKLKYFFFYIISVFNLSLWPISGLIFIGKVIYMTKEMLISKKILYYKLITFFFILVTYIILNLDYLKFNLARDFHYTHISNTFFYNYHFRTFFGTIFNGGIFLLVFGILLIKSLKNVLYLNNKENILIYIILSTYLMTMVYSAFKASIMSPKYVIFLVPIIIIWIVIKISRLKYSKFILIIISVLSIFNLLNISGYPMKRPEVKNALNFIVKDEGDNLVYSIEPTVFNNYLSTKKLFKYNNFKFVNPNELISKDQFWFICLNNPRYAYGNNSLELNVRCKVLKNNKNFEQLIEKKFPDLILIKYKKLSK